MYHSTFRRLSTLVVILSLVMLAATAALAQDSSGSMKKADDQGQMMSKGMEAMPMAHKDMSFIYTADTLYTCPNHPWFVTDKADAHCAVKACETKLVMMTPDQVKALRDSNPKGDAGCSVAVPGNSDMTKCPVCGAPLEPIQKPGDGMMMAPKKDEMAPAKPKNDSKKGM